MALGITVVFLLVSSVVNIFLNRPVETDFITNAYSNVRLLPLFWIAIVVIAPLFEEAFIRGFLFIGLARSRIGPAGAVILTALVWASLHIVEYGIYEIIVIGVLGIILGVVRYKTGSLWSSVIIHSLNNLVAVLLVHLAANGILS